MAQKGNPINLAFDISTLKYNMKKKKKAQEEKDTSASMDKEEAKQKISKGNVEFGGISSKALIDGGGVEEKNSQTYLEKTLLYQDNTSISTLQLIIRNLEKELFDKKTEIRMLSKNFKEKISLTEAENKKIIDAIEDKYSILLDNISESAENRIKEVALQYEANTSSLQKEHLSLLNDFRMTRASHISIDTHKEKMSELNETWENKYNLLRKEYEVKYKELFNKMNEAIEMKMSLCNSSNSMVALLTPEEMIRTISKIQLEHEIGYSSYVYELLGKYNQVYAQFNGNKKDSLDVLKTFVIKKFNELMMLNSNCNNDNKRKGGKHQRDNEDNNNPLIHNKVNELVNYDSSKMHSSMTRNQEHEKDSLIKYNDISQDRSKMHDNFTSEFESFNFNEDSLPDRNIQVLTPPDMIK